MGLASFLSRRRRADAADLAIQIAVLSRESIAGQALDRARRMNLGEARGYLRARSRETVARQAGLLFGRHAELKPVEQDHILTLALDQVVQLMMRDLVASTPAARRKVA
jgi:hypothetical protein